MKRGRLVKIFKGKPREPYMPNNPISPPMIRQPGPSGVWVDGLYQLDR